MFVLHYVCVCLFGRLLELFALLSMWFLPKNICFWTLCVWFFFISLFFLFAWFWFLWFSCVFALLLGFLMFVFFRFGLVFSSYYCSTLNTSITLTFRLIRKIMFNVLFLLQIVWQYMIWFHNFLFLPEREYLFGIWRKDSWGYFIILYFSMKMDNQILAFVRRNVWVLSVSIRWHFLAQMGAFLFIFQKF